MPASSSDPCFWATTLMCSKTSEKFDLPFSLTAALQSNVFFVYIVYLANIKQKNNRKITFVMIDCTLEV